MPLKTAPYGTWESPISADAITQKALSIADVIVDQTASTVYHIERRATGNSALVNTRTSADVIAGDDWDVRCAVHEYGGAPAVSRDGFVYFSNAKIAKDGDSMKMLYGVYKVKEGESPTSVVPDSAVYRFGNFSVHPAHPNLILAVLEDHTIDRPDSVQNYVALLDATAHTSTILLKGADFYAAPTFSPDGTHICWQEWYHPDMPWFGSFVSVAPITLLTADNGAPTGITVDTTNVNSMGGKGKLACCHASWASPDTVLFTSDKSGYQNPWMFSVLSGKFSPILKEPVEEDFCAPQWQLGNSPYAVLSEDRAVWMAYRGGRTVLYACELKPGTAPTEVDCPYVDLSSMRSLAAGSNAFACWAVGAKTPASVVLCSLPPASLSPAFEILKSSLSGEQRNAYPEALISVPEPKTVKVPPHDALVHGVYYAPTNPEYSGSSIEGERPPCIVNSHGGPTSMAGQGLQWAKQFFTSRGFAWLDVNYGGSSGYGRKYIERLNGQWGIVDALDTIHFSQALSSGLSALVDPKRMTIRGGSSGGYTVLCALATAPAPENAFFAAGNSFYGISNLELLVSDTHKFESKYMEGLIGGTFKEIPEVYKERSPVTSAKRIQSPLLILQGTEDKVVPPNQADRIHEAILENKGICEYKLYDGEGHGWRRADTQKDALERELAFYLKQLGIKS